MTASNSASVVAGPRWRGLAKNPWLRVAVSVVLTGIGLAYALHRVEWSSFVALLGSLRIPELLVLAALVPLLVLLAARRWVLASRRLGVSIDREPAFARYYLASLLNQLLPGGVAGDLLRVYQQRKLHQSTSLAAPAFATVIDRGLTVWCTSLLATLALCLWPALADVEQVRSELAFRCCLGVTVAGALLILLPGLLWRWWKPSTPAWSPWAEACYRVCFTGRECREFWISTFVSSVTLVVGLCIAADALGIELGLLGFLCLPAIVLSMAVPWLQGGWGGREFSAVVLLPTAGVGANEAVALAVVYGVAVLLGSLPAVYWLLRPPTAVAEGATLPRLSRDLARWPGIVGFGAFAAHLLSQLPRVIADAGEFQFVVRIPRTPNAVDWSVLFARNGFDLWRLNLDLVLAFVGLALGLRLTRRGWAQRVLVALATGSCVVVLLWEFNVLGGLMIMHQQPLLYDEAHLLLHLGVLISDLINPSLVAMFIGGLAVVAAMVYLMYRSLSLFAATQDSKLGLWVPLTLGLLVIPGYAQEDLSRRDLVFHSTLAQVSANVERSHELWQQVENGRTQSPYRGFDELSLREKPDIAFYIIESYGRVVREHPRMRGPWQAKMLELDERLAAAGWSFRSGYSTAPVSGGRSWLADGSMFFGREIRHESLYRHMLGTLPDTPNLFNFLQHQGYHVLRLAPTDRDRPGIVNRNEWGFDTQLIHVDLDYTGSKIGWGMIPDQYSLGFVHSHHPQSNPRPDFLFFHMVTAHAPWKRVPALVDDWRELGVPGVALGESSGVATPKKRVEPSAKDVWLARAERFRRQREFNTKYMGNLTDARAERYLDAVLYDFEVLVRHLEADEDTELVVIMGDHQPPMISRHAESFDTPVHVLARDERWLREFERRKFRPSMDPGGRARGRMRHEDMFILIVQTLLRGDGQVPENLGVPERAPDW